jgi:LysM repeat protein
MSIRRWLPFIFVNLLVSIFATLAVLYFWGPTRQTEVAVEPTQAVVIDVPTPIVTGQNGGEAVVPAEEQQPSIVEESSNYPTHAVQPGDTLGNLSVQYGVPLADIMVLNGISNENLIQVGQVLEIPVGGLPTATPIPSSTPAPTLPAAPTAPPTAVPATATPDFVAGVAEIGVVEVSQMGILTEEAVVIVNSGSQALGLEGWTLRDVQGHVYTFGAVTLFGDGISLRVHTEAGIDQATDLYWGLAEAIWAPGETVILRDNNGEVRSQYLIP